MGCANPVKMAFRSAVHKSTSLTPNMLMLGRATCIPLDLIYEMSGPDVLYAVSCGRKGEKQIIHCDRMRKRKDQILNFESLELGNDETVNYEELEKVDVACSSNIDSVEELVNHDENKRARRKSKWLNDYET